MDPFTKLISTKEPPKESIKIRTKEDLIEAVEKLPAAQGNLFRKLYIQIRRAARIVPQAQRIDLDNFSLYLLDKLANGSNQKFEEDVPRGERLMFEQFIRGGRFREAFSIYPDVGVRLRDHIKGLMALTNEFEDREYFKMNNPWRNLIVQYLTNRPYVSTNILRLVGDPRSFNNIDQEQIASLRQIGMVEPLHFLFSQIITRQAGCKISPLLGLQKRMNYLFPSFDYNNIEQLCAFAQKYRGLKAD